MGEHSALIATVAVGLSAALVAALIAVRLRLPTIVGYLVAGVAVGPFTPGFTADATLAPQLADLGVILLMFGVGSHFSLRELLTVRRIAVPGALAQIVLITVAGLGLGLAWGWPWGQSLVFGLALAVASTVVMLRALATSGDLEGPAGRIGVGWLIVEDLLMIAVLVALPTLAGALGGLGPHLSATAVAGHLAITLGKVALFIVLMLTIGARLVPWLLERVQRTGNRELFILATLATALGIAYGAAVVFEVSFALGAFLAGLVVGESEVSHHAMEEALPLREAFAVLFFVSVGMVLDPRFFLQEPLRILAVLGVIVALKFAVVWLIARIGGLVGRTALALAAGRAQIGEFSFILAEVGHRLGLVTPEARNLILAGALLSIVANPLLFALVGRASATPGGSPTTTVGGTSA